MTQILSACRRFIQLIKISRSKTTGAENLGELGSGAGKGGGWGGKIREAGGSLGKHAAAMEEEYFHKKNIEQLEELKSRMQEQLKVQQEEIDKIQKQVDDQKKCLDELKSCFKKY